MIKIIIAPRIVPVFEVFVGESVTYILGNVEQLPPEHLTHVSPPLQSTETLVLLEEFLLSSGTDEIVLVLVTVLVILVVVLDI